MLQMVCFLFLTPAPFNSHYNAGAEPHLCLEPLAHLVQFSTAFIFFLPVLPLDAACNGLFRVKPASWPAFQQSESLSVAEIATWHHWCDGSFYQAKEAQSKSAAKPARMGWAFVIVGVNQLSTQYAIFGIASGVITQYQLEWYDLPRPGADVSEAFAVHEAVRWASTVYAPWTIHFDSKVAGHVAEGVYGFSKPIASITRATRGLLYTLLHRHPGVTFEHVKSHTGVPLNEQADDAAKAAARCLSFPGQTFHLPREWYLSSHPVADWAWLLHRAPADKELLGLPPVEGNDFWLPSPDPVTAEHLTSRIPLDSSILPTLITRTFQLTFASINVG